MPLPVYPEQPQRAVQPFANNYPPPPQVRPEVRSKQGETVLLLIMLGWAAVNLVAGGIQVTESGIYTSQVLLGAITAMLTVIRIVQRRQLSMPSGALILLITFALPMIAGGTGNDRFVPEQVKMLMLIAGASAISAHITWAQIRAFAIVLPPLLCMTMAVVWAIGAGDYYGEGRFGIPTFGSPNSTMFVMLINLTLALYLASTRAARSKLWLYDGLVILILLGGIVATQSDGGTLTMAVLALRYLGLRMRTVIVAATALLIGTLFFIWLFPSFEIPELLGSGRLYIWTVLLEDQFSAGAVNLLFGFGPGAIDMEPMFTASVRSAHSMFLEILYSYGLVGFVVLVASIIGLGIRLGKAPLAPKQRTFLQGLFLAFFAGGLVDTYFLTAQLGWLGALSIGFFGLASKERADEAGAAQ